MDQMRESSPSTEGLESDLYAEINRQEAVIVGVGDYEGKFAALTNASNDAQELACLLSGDYEFNLIPNGSPIINSFADLNSIKTAIQTSLKNANSGTRWMFFFAGHGIVNDGKGYLIPSNGVLGKEDTYLPINWIIDECKQSSCAEALIILDSCYSGQALLQPDDFNDLIPPNQQSGRIIQIITSGNPDQPVLDVGGNGHSIFTQSLLETLEGWSGIHNKDGNIQVTNLISHLVFDVAGRLYKQQLPASSQRPIGGYLLRSRKGQVDFTFTSLVPRLPPEVVRNSRNEIPTWREQALDDLVNIVKSSPKLLSSAFKLALGHLSTSSSKSLFLVTSFLNFEPVTSVRVKAAQVLGDLGDKRAIEPLAMALSDDLQVCRASIRSLISLEATQKVNVLLERLKSIDDSLFLEIVNAIVCLGSYEEVLSALLICIQRGKLVPFIGPDIQKELTGHPSRKDLIQTILRRIDYPELRSLAQIAEATITDKKRYTEICSSCGSYTERSGNRFVFTDLLKQELDEKSYTPGYIYNLFSRLPIKFWVSCVYNNFLQNSLKASTIVRGIDVSYFGTTDHTVVQLLGNINDPDSLQVLEVDLQQHLRRDIPLAIYLREILNGKLVLFIGFDPTSIDFQYLMEYMLGMYLQESNVCALMLWQLDETEVYPSKIKVHLLNQNVIETLIRLANAL